MHQGQPAGRCNAAAGIQPGIETEDSAGSSTQARAVHRNTLRIHMKRDELRTRENPAKVLSLLPPVRLQTYMLDSRPSMLGQISTLPVSGPLSRARGNALSLLQPEKQWRGSLMLV